MTIKELTITVQLLEDLKVKGGKTYKDISNALRQEATSHNIQLLEDLLFKLQTKQ